MKIINRPSELRQLNIGTCVTWGNFDSVHLGHQKILGYVSQKAKRLGLKSVVITFTPHPLKILGTAPPIITPMPTRLKLIAQQGIDITLVLPFDTELATLEPESFVTKVILNPMNTQQMVLGYSSFFGKGGRGSVSLLSRMGEELGFEVEQLSPLFLDGSVVSSTRIRNLIEAGSVSEVSPLLGRNHFVEGHIVKGRQLGRKLGFPTINIEPGVTNPKSFPPGYTPIPSSCDQEFDALAGMLPLGGVYAVWAEISGLVYRAVASIGTNPTFEKTHGEISARLEVHILNFNQDIYNQDVRVHFVKRLRDSHCFDSPDLLKRQISLDAEEAKAIFFETNN